MHSTTGGVEVASVVIPGHSKMILRRERSTRCWDPHLFGNETHRAIGGGQRKRCVRGGVLWSTSRVEMSGTWFTLPFSVPAGWIKACCMKQHWHSGREFLTSIRDLVRDCTSSNVGNLPPLYSPRRPARRVGWFHAALMHRGVCRNIENGWTQPSITWWAMISVWGRAKKLGSQLTISMAPSLVEGGSAAGWSPASVFLSMEF